MGMYYFAILCFPFCIAVTLVVWKLGCFDESREPRD
jgi:hypothetical protein